MINLSRYVGEVETRSGEGEGNRAARRVPSLALAGEDPCY